VHGTRQSWYQVVMGNGGLSVGRGITA
jgi:hypothetical protein